MQPQDMVFGTQVSPTHDVAKPQDFNLNILQCLSPMRQGIVSKGRTQAVDTSHLGRLPGQSGRSTQQEPRSRGCPRAQRPFLPFARLPSWQLAAAAKRPKLSTSKTPQFRKSRLTLANTSKNGGRAGGASRVIPALFLWPALFACRAVFGGAAC